VRTIRTLLTGFLLVAAFLLSFTALRHIAVAAGIIHGDLGIPLWVATLTLSVHTQAGIWALTPDVLAGVGILGVRADRRDPRAWTALVLGLGLTLLFQVWGDPWPWLLRAVPASAGAVAVWLLEVPWGRRVVPGSAVQPAQVPAATQLATQVARTSSPQPSPAPGPTAQPTAAYPKAARPGGLSAAQRTRVEGWVAAGERNKSEMARRLGLSARARKERLSPLVDQLVDQLAGQGVPGNNGQGSMEE